VITAKVNPPQITWQVAAREFHFGLPPSTAPLLMGIVNTTPDSFSDGGKFLAPDEAVSHALRLVAEGADIIDLGGQSTRPGSEPVSVEEELQRVLPAIKALRPRTNALISVDTSKAEVARQALAAGAQIINDVTALSEDPAMIDVLAESDAGVVIMHMLGTPKTMQLAPSYTDVVREVMEFLARRVDWAVSHGVVSERIAIDPGIGFGKSIEHSLKLMHELDRLSQLGRPVCLGPSRKQVIGKVLDRPVGERTHGTIGACVAGYLHGANILRVHDVAAVRDALLVVRAIELAAKPT